MDKSVRAALTAHRKGQVVEDGRVKIEYGAIRNNRGDDHGWLPQVWVNGRATSDTYRHQGFDEGDAIERAQSMANKEQGKYSGDWDITIEER